LPRLGFPPVGQRGGRLFPERHPPSWAEVRLIIVDKDASPRISATPLRRQAARFTAGRFSYYDPGMTDETDKRDGVASRMPLWGLAILAAVAFGAYAYFILDF
jgi:hypothetical protein